MSTNQNKILKISGYALSIIGVMATFISFTLVFGVIADMMGLQIGNQTISANSTVVTLIASIVALIASLSQAITGIFGIKNCYSSNPSKIKLCMILGIVTIVLNIAFLLTSTLGVIFGTIGIVIAIVYVIGTVKSKKA